MVPAAGPTWCHHVPVDDLIDPTSDSDVRVARRPRKPIRLAIGLILVILVLGFAFAAWRNRPEFSLSGPDGTVAPGEQVTIRDPDGGCGPLIVSMWKPSILGQWNRTHNGSAVGDSFSRDPHPWWKLWGTETYATGVPCSLNGEMTFTLPPDVESGAVAVCDSNRRCAKLEVD